MPKKPNAAKKNKQQLANQTAEEVKLPSISTAISTSMSMSSIVKSNQTPILHKNLETVAAAATVVMEQRNPINNISATKKKKKKKNKQLQQQRIFVVTFI